jgi:hypothetical protein
MKKGLLLLFLLLISFKVNAIGWEKITPTTFIEHKQYYPMLKNNLKPSWNMAGNIDILNHSTINLIVDENPDTNILFIIMINIIILLFLIIIKECIRLYDKEN